MLAATSEATEDSLDELSLASDVFESSEVFNDCEEERESLKASEIAELMEFLVYELPTPHPIVKISMYIGICHH